METEGKAAGASHRGELHCPALRLIASRRHRSHQRYIIDSKNETAISVQAAIGMSKLIVISAESFHDAKLQQMRQKQKKKTKVFIFGVMPSDVKLSRYSHSKRAFLPCKGGEERKLSFFVNKNTIFSRKSSFICFFVTNFAPEKSQ